MSSSTSPKSSGDSSASPDKQDEASAPDTANDGDGTASDALRASNGEVTEDSGMDRAGREAAASANASEFEDARAHAGQDDADPSEDPPSAAETPDKPEGAGADSDEDQEEETLDLRALFASSEPEFDSPTDTFELARGAKPEPRAGAEDTADVSMHQDGAPAGSDTEFPFDLPADSVIDDSAHTGDAPKSAAFAGFGGHAGQGDEAANALSGTPGDPLADAVQSALRSVYGDNDEAETAGQRSDAPESGASGPILQWAGTGAADDADDAPADDDALYAASGEDPQDTASIDEETTEAVLSYLYEQVGSEGDGEAATSNDPAAARDVLNARPNADQRIEEAWAAQVRLAETSIPPSHAAEYEPAPPQAIDAASAPHVQQPATAEAASQAPAETFHAPVDMGAAQYEASGKLLGAAGLGLIGGIAATGVAAVFVFNSFVTQPDPTSTQQVRRDTSAPETSRATESQSGEASRTSAANAQPTAASANTETAGSETDQPTAVASESAAPAGDATNNETSASIGARAVSGTANEAIPLALSVPQGDGDRFLRITGLPDGVKLSAGVDTGNGSWLLSAGRAEDLTLTAPDTLSGVFTLDAQLLGADARTPLSEDVSFEVEVAGASVAEAEAGETRTAAFDPETTSPAVAGQPPAPMERAESLLRSGDVRAAREILRTETEADSGEAALALGKSYDPRTFTGLTSANASPDATEAFRWYQRAAELGNPNGNSQISELKAWLLR